MAGPGRWADTAIRREAPAGSSGASETPVPGRVVEAEPQGARWGTCGRLTAPGRGGCGWCHVPGPAAALSAGPVPQLPVPGHCVQPEQGVCLLKVPHGPCTARRSLSRPDKSPLCPQAPLPHSRGPQGSRRFPHSPLFCPHLRPAPSYRPTALPPACCPCPPFHLRPPLPLLCSPWPVPPSRPQPQPLVPTPLTTHTLACPLGPGFLDPGAAPS